MLFATGKVIGPAYNSWPCGKYLTVVGFMSVDWTYVFKCDNAAKFSLNS